MNRFLISISPILVILILFSCINRNESREIIWEEIKFSKVGSIKKIEYTHPNLTYNKIPWYVMVTVNTPTLISFCSYSEIYPSEGNLSGSQNLFLAATNESCELKVTIFGKRDSIVLNPVVYGSMSELWQYQIKKDGFMILFGSFYILIGIFALYIFLLKQTYFQYLAFSGLLLIAGIYSISIGNELFGMIFPSFPSEYWIPTLLGSLYLLPGVLLWFLSFLLMSKWKRRFRIVGLSYLVLMSMILLSLSLLEIEYDVIVTPFHLVCILFLVVFFPPLYLVLRNPNHNLTRVLLGLALFLIFAFLEMGISYFTKNMEFPLLSFGFFCFLIPLGEFSIHEFFRLKSKIQNVKDIQNFREVRSSESSKSRISNLNEDDVVERIRNLVEVEKIYLDESMSLGKLAKRLQIREDQTSYIINRKFKMTFYSLINSHRIEEAKKLLKKNEVNILNVAFSVGFQSKSAFNSIFKKYTKMTPSEFQKQVSMN